MNSLLQKKASNSSIASMNSIKSNSTFGNDLMYLTIEPIEKVAIKSLLPQQAVILIQAVQQLALTSLVHYYSPNTTQAYLFGLVLVNFCIQIPTFAVANSVSKDVIENMAKHKGQVAKVIFMYGQLVGVFVNVVLSIAVGLLMKNILDNFIAPGLFAGEIQGYLTTLAFGQILTYHFSYATTPYNLAENCIQMDIMKLVWTSVLELSLYAFMTLQSKANGKAYGIDLVAQAKIISQAIIAFIMFVIQFNVGGNSSLLRLNFKLFQPFRFKVLLLVFGRACLEILFQASEFLPIFVCLVQQSFKVTILQKEANVYRVAMYWLFQNLAKQVGSAAIRTSQMLIVVNKEIGKYERILRYYSVGFAIIFAYNFAICMLVYVLFNEIFGLIFAEKLAYDLSMIKYAALEPIISIFRQFAAPLMQIEGKKLIEHSVYASQLIAVIIAAVWVNVTQNTYDLLPLIFAAQLSGDFFGIAAFIYGIRLLRSQVLKQQIRIEGDETLQLDKNVEQIAIREDDEPLQLYTLDEMPVRFNQKETNVVESSLEPKTSSGDQDFPQGEQDQVPEVAESAKVLRSSTDLLQMRQSEGL